MVLAVDTSSAFASCAIADENKIIAELSVLNQKTHSKIIVGMISKLIEFSGVKLSEFDYFACSKGPGSYTGLRIGASCVKGFAHAFNKKIVPVSALDALAYNVFNSDRIICPIVDARNNHVFSAFYTVQKGEISRLSDYSAEKIDIVLDRALSYNKPVLFLGGGVDNYKTQIQDCNFETGNPALNAQKASSMAMLAIELAKNGLLEPYDVFVPEYIGRSQEDK